VGFAEIFGQRIIVFFTNEKYLVAKPEPTFALITSNLFLPQSL